MDHKRGPLVNIIQATTGEDIRKCNRCQPCCFEVTEQMDLTIGEMLHTACRDERKALKSKTLWNCDPVLEYQAQCLGGLDLTRVIQLLRQEAIIRGIVPPDSF
jgi:heterodisulfide reductase subunit C